MELFNLGSALNKERKRTFRVIGFYIVFVLVILLALITALLIYNINSKEIAVNYDENIKTDYKVYLTENEYFESEYLDENRDYISDLIDRIIVTFKYKNSLQKQSKYVYCSRVTANLEVLGNESKKILFNHEDLLYENDNFGATDSLDLTKDINIDYNRYNNLVKSFVNTYSLTNANAFLNINLYVSVHTGHHQTHTSFGTPVSTIIIPLNKHTVSIDSSLDIFNKDKVLVINQESSNLNKSLIIALGTISTILFILFLNMKLYISRKRTPFHKFERRYAYITRNYHTYINKVYKKVDTTGMNVIKINSFEDLLSIRDELSKPIIEYIDLGVMINYIVINNNIVYQYDMVLEDWYNEKSNTK